MGAVNLSQISETIQQTTSLSIDWNEVVLLAIGAAIGLIASLATIAIQRFLDQKGKLNIFYRITNQRGATGSGWGFENSQDGYLYLTVPVVFELQNTSNTTRVVRDVNFLLYRDNLLIDKMVQIGCIQSTTQKDGVVTKKSDHHFGTEKESYSFVLAPRSIQKQECHYAYKIRPSEKDNKMFNRIVARYYDEKNKPHLFIVRDICNSWEVEHFNADEEWILLDNKVKIG